MARLMKLLRNGYERAFTFWGYSIRHQLIISFGLVVLLAMASFSYLMFIQQRAFLYDTHTNRAKGLAHALAASSSSLVLTNDVAGLQEVLHGLADMPDLNFALVLSVQGEVLAATNPELIGRYINDSVSKRLLTAPAAFNLLLDNKTLTDVAMPIKANNRHVGWARVEMTRQASNINLNHLGWTGAGFSLLAVIASFVIAAWLSWRLTGQFYHLIKVMRAVENDDRQVRATITTKDEVGRLAQSFNRMLDTLSHSERELGRINRLYAAWTESSEVIVRQKDEHLLLDSICQILAERVPFKLVWIGELQDNGWVRPVVAKGVSTAYLDTINVSTDSSIQEGQGPGSIALRTGMHQVSNQFLDDANAYWHNAARKFNFNSVGAFPLSRGGKVNSYIAVYSSEPHFFSAELIRLMSGLAGDITFALDNLDREHAQRAAAIKLEQAATVFEYSKEGIMVTDANNRIISVNRSFVEITGYSADEVVGQNPRILSSGLQPADFYADMWAAIEEHGSWQGEIMDRRKNGEIYPEALTIIRVTNTAGEIINHLAIFSDISEQRTSQERIQQLAYYDVLTSLPNRVLFSDRLQQAIFSAQRNQAKIALLFLDIDRFKQINDTLGHGAGDSLLQHVGQRLLGCIREQDTVSRLGGDEFVIVLNDAGIAGAELVAQKILLSILQPYLIEGHDLRISASIGIAVYPDHADNMENLIKYADVAMYQAKENGRNCYRHFDPAMNASAYERLKLESELRGALERNELCLYYQPQVSLEDEHIVGCEALVRWQHAELGMINPEKFIPLAEETGLIISINDWVLEQAIKQCSVWRQAGFKALTMSVNLSAPQFRQPGLAQQIRRLLETYDLPPEMLDLELTEGILMQGVERTLTTLHELSAMGVILSIDDFGTGYSSLSYLKRFPIQQLKIDQSFVRDVTNDASDATMVRTIILMAKGLHLDVIAEGVETEAQAAFLYESGCERAQGYHFKRPISAQAFEALLEQEELSNQHLLAAPHQISQSL